MFVALLSGAGFVLGQVELPDEDPLLQSTFVCANDVTQGCGPDNAIAKLAGEEDRVSLPLEEIPQTFIDAVLAAEDRKFFTHAGIDPVGIARAVYQEVRGSSAQQGGSTITQQYAKNAFLSSERTITRKLKEAVLAVKLEREFSKNEILQRYLNTVYFGRGAYGAEAAARIYFGVSIRNVDLSQAAYLAALIRSPESTDVARNPETAVFRRNSVLDGMLEQGWITRDEYDAAKAKELSSEVRERSVREGLGDVVGSEFGSEYYVEYIRRLLYDEYGADVVNGGGLRVYTSLDMGLQQAAYESVYRDVLDQEDDPAGALVSVDDVGRVVALVGGKDFDASEVNLALGALAGGSGRPPGSSFKPIVLAEALGQDISARSKFINENDIVLPRANNGEDWEVGNYADGTESLVDLVDATKVSSNTVYAQLMLEVGPANVVALAERLGVKTPLPAVNSLVLGSGDVSVLDMANAYSTFARRGEAVEPVFITKVEQVRDGEVKTLFQASGKGEQVMRRGDADQLNWILRQVVLGGTGSGANPGYPVAGKTGTSGDYRDAWFVGYSPRLTTAVWMGYPDLDADGNTRFMTDVRGRKVTGGSFPATIWKLFMQRASDGDGSFADPPPFGGTVLNADLTTTTTTLPVCEPVDPDAESTGTTEPCRKPSTTTTEASEETTTTGAPGSTSTSSTSSTTSTTKPDTTTTVAPTTTEFLGGN
ncbi:transglycosylase domain-containing protein [Actinospongicola halichondriae]|uniref:transglycosylase domain-containing protein n=1 Tax=Actinospongicola halichondriae TaxID=3236844 RepID=UPI003D58A4B7